MTLRCENLQVTLGGAHVLDGVSLEAGPGLNVLVGANGSGKTTLLRALAGLQPIRAGSIWLDGESITRLGAAARRRSGLLFRGQRPLMVPGLLSSDYLRLAFGESSLSRTIDRATAAGFPGDIAHSLAAPLRIDQMPLRDRRMLELMTAAAGDAVALLGPMLDALASRSALLIVEHRREFFAWLAERPASASFIAGGQILLSGVDANALLADPRVLASYGSLE
jgi:ABC-type uncharacterized transport system ATPase subunit